MNKFIITGLLLILFVSSLDAQTVPSDIQRYRADELGTRLVRKEGTMDGNLVRTLFYNTTEVAQWPLTPSGEWPKGSGINYVDGICLLLAAEIKAPGAKNFIHPLEGFYREEMDLTTAVPDLEISKEPWGLNGVPGYSNELNRQPAMSNSTITWPEFWPTALGLTPAYNGQWYGYFGRNIFNADLETFFVSDDSKDAEFTRYVSPTRGAYYPINADTVPSPPVTASDRKQWYNPNIRKGLGLRVETRGFQWSHPLAENMIFWHYDIINLSDHDYAKTYFGFYTDTGLGGSGDNGDDFASYDKRLDITYGYDYDNKVAGRPDIRLGTYGYAYLESPGKGNDFINNDDDVDKNHVPMVDEKRDNGIDDDGDWRKFIDSNNNGFWDWDSVTQVGEPLLDDVGRDGAGPYDEPYDPISETVKKHTPDFGEGNGVPDDGEPNFDRLDKDESDQIGLTSVKISELADKGPQSLWLKNDEYVWEQMNSVAFDTSVQKKNIQIVFASGPFPLNTGANRIVYGRERFSMALVFAKNYQDLEFQVKTVQLIYNNGYNFSKPPIKPILTAKAGDKKVYLYWDKRAEDSTDPIMGFENNDPSQGPKKDFEGYTIYRSKEPQFTDVKTITDSQGTPKYYRPIAQFDLVDEFYGPDPVGINGASFWRGDNTGLQHSYVDEDVENGFTYYYAVVSYDQGLDIDSISIKLQPSECTKIISESLIGNITFIDQNCAVVTPNAKIGGFEEPKAGFTSTATFGTGTAQIDIFDNDKLKENSNYEIVFKHTGNMPSNYKTSVAVVRDGTDTITASKINTLVATNPTATNVFDGILLTVRNDTTIKVVEAGTKWLSANPQNLPTFSVIQNSGRLGAPYTPYYFRWPSDYQIEFYDHIVDTSLKNTITNAPKLKRAIPSKFKIKNLTTQKYVDFYIEINDTTLAKTRDTLAVGLDRVIISEIDPNFTLKKEYWPWYIQWGFLGENLSKRTPTAGDIYKIKTTQVFNSQDRISFSVKKGRVNSESAKSALSNIRVVPNPYIGGVRWEPRAIEPIGRGQRRIDFINLPQSCTIRIYNLAGILVRTLKKENADSGSLSWDLRTDDNLDTAFGVYVYHVDAPGLGEHFGKLGLIK